MPKRTVLNSQAREMVVRLRDYFEKERENGGPMEPIGNVIDRVAQALCIGKSTVTRITKEKYGSTSMEENKLSTPNKRNRKKKQPITGVDSFDTDAIRNHIYGYYERSELPTLFKLLRSLKAAGLFGGRATSLWRVVKSIGFRYKMINKRKILMERTDIALARVTFLLKAKEIENWEQVVFVDETWLNANHTVSKTWTDDTVSASTKVPVGKGERLIICHAGNANGFIPNSLLAFKSKKTGEYHEEMNAQKFKDWFQNMLQNLEQPSIIIMDNASYHSVQLNRAPSKDKNKSEQLEWLQNNNITADMSMFKVQLVNLVQMHKPRVPTYELDEMAKQHGHQVLRLPPYHCQYNAIEMIWAQVKGFAARNNTAPPFTAMKMLSLLEAACQNVTPDDWKNVVEKTRKTILEDWERDIRLDTLMDQQEFIINVGDSDTSTSDSSSEN